MVQVSVESPCGLVVELSQVLRERCRLQRVQVVPHRLASDGRMRHLAQAGDLYLNRHIGDRNRLDRERAPTSARGPSSGGPPGTGGSASSILAQLGLVATTVLADLRRLGSAGEVLGRFS